VQRFLFDSCRKNWGGRPALDSFGGWDKQIIYTNFFVASVDWWLSEQVGVCRWGLIGAALAGWWWLLELVGV